MAEFTGRQPTWAEINRVLLPELEGSSGTVALPPGDHVAVVGAHRSGTTWLANLLGDGLAADRAFEKDCARILLGTRRTTGQDRRVLQGTFLMPCPRAAASLTARCFTVAIVRDPVDVVRSMVHNWSGLEDVAALVEAVHGLRLPTNRVDCASRILRESLQVLADLLARKLVNLAISYSELVGAWGTVVGVVADGIGHAVQPATGWTSAHAPHPSIVRPSQLMLSGSEEQRVRLATQSLYLEVVAMMGTSRPPIEHGS